MEEKKQLSTQELSQVKELQQKFQTIQLELGEIEISKLQLEKRHQQIKESLFSLQKEEETFTKSLFEKYGDVNINLSTGEIESVE